MNGIGILVVGLLVIVAYYSGLSAKRFRLPSIIGFILVGILLGPSLLNVIDAGLERRLEFLTKIALGFVALSIGLELRLAWLRKQGAGIVLAILGQCVGAYVLVAAAVYGLLHLTEGINGLANSTQFLALSLVLGALATATDPAGTVAVIKEYKAKGDLTQTLYAVVGYDDALAVAFFGVSLAIAHSLLLRQAGEASATIIHAMAEPLKELVLSCLVGCIIGGSFSILARKLKRLADMLILIVGFTFIANGLSEAHHLSFILTNMVFGFVVINTQPMSLIERIRDDLAVVMPLLFILLFGLAGAHLDVRMLPKLGLVGVVYVISRCAGKILGIRAAAACGGLNAKLRKYLGPGLFSQAGVAIGLGLVASHELKGIGIPALGSGNGQVPVGTIISAMVIATVMGSSVFFAIVGPIMVKIVLRKAGEIPEDAKII